MWRAPQPAADSVVMLTCRIRGTSEACREVWSAERWAFLVSRLIPAVAVRSIFRSHRVLLVAFAFAVMGDPVSSVSYAIEAALRALHGDLGLLVPTMALVLGVIVLVSLNSHQLYARFPEGGGDAAATGAAFGEGWAFLPLGSLIVDYALTITISAAAGASAIIAYVPSLASWRIPLALTLLVVVAGLTWFGHGGRVVLAAMTIAFVVVPALVLPPRRVDPVRAATGGGTVFAAFHVTTAVLLLAAASSSFQAGPGLLKALSRGGGGVGVLPLSLGRTNRHHTPYWGVVVFLGVSAALVVAAAAREQRLVLFYAVAVFIAFLCGLLSMARFFRAEGRRLLLATSLLGALAVSVTLG